MFVLSREAHPVVQVRCDKMGITCHHAVEDKATFLRDYAKKEGIDLSKIAYLGNDTNDLECLKMVGFPVVVADAHPDVVSAAKIALEHEGGKGAVREFCDKILAAR